MNIWLVMLLGGLVTFGMRFSFIYLFGKIHISETMRRALHYVPPAVLSAIIAPELLFPEKHFDFSLDNTRLIAGIIATLTAWYSKNTLVTILVGMLALMALQFLGK